MGFAAGDERLKESGGEDFSWSDFDGGGDVDTAEAVLCRDW